MPEMVVRFKIEGHVWKDGPPAEGGWYWLDVDGHQMIRMVRTLGDGLDNVSVNAVRHCGPIPKPLEPDEVDAKLRRKFPRPKQQKETTP
jgi:hypothetical protein